MSEEIELKIRYMRLSLEFVNTIEKISEKSFIRKIEILSKQYNFFTQY